MMVVLFDILLLSSLSLIARAVIDIDALPNFQNGYLFQGLLLDRSLHKRLCIWKGFLLGRQSRCAGQFAELVGELL